MKDISGKKQEKGITLIALVITIIVLLILVSVSIATLTGENGLLAKATNASKETKRASDKEELEVAILGICDENDSTINYKELQKELADWKIDQDTGEAISPNGNPFNIKELLKDSLNPDPNPNPTPDTNKKVYLDDAWRYTVDEITKTATIVKYGEKYTETKDLELIPQELIVPNYIKSENGDIPIKTVGGGAEYEYKIWADCISTTPGGYRGYPR